MNFEDLLGTDSEPVGGNEIDPAPEGKEFRSLQSAYVHDLERGVTISWLAQAFKMPRHKVEKRLIGCPVMKAGTHGAKIYHFATACAYMVDPRVDVRRYIENMDRSELPEQLRMEYWSARQKEQVVRRNAGELWRDEDVLGAFGSVMMLIKDTVKLWTDQVEKRVGVTDEQRDLLDDLSRDLLQQIGDKVESYCKKDKTPSQEIEFEIEVDDL